MNSQTKNEIDLSAILNTVVYLDNNGFEGKTLQQIYNTCNSDRSSLSKDQCRALDSLGKALENREDLRGIEVVHTSRLDVGSVPDVNSRAYDPGKASDVWQDDYIQGMTFRDPDGNYYVSYRGTGDGRWIDNGEGMVHTTEMQKAAAMYFDQAAEKFGFQDAHDAGKRIIVTGHSKGGNEAQYVYMASNHAELIDACYSLDGQGFSEKTIAEFEARWHAKVGSEEWNERLKNLYSICGENDYVHPLGIEIVSPENLYYIKTSGYGPGPFHDINYMFTDDGRLDWITNNGQVINGESGFWAEFGYYLSEEMMKIPPEHREGAAKTLMMLIDAWFQGTSPQEMLNLSDPVTFDNIVDFLTYAPEALLDALMNTLIGEDAWSVIGFFCGAALLLLDPVRYGSLLLIRELILKNDRIMDTIKNTIRQIYNTFEKFVSRIAEWYNKKTAGYRYATDHPVIVLNTALFEQYANRLALVNNRLGKMDKNMKSLYAKVGWLDLWRLMSADLLTERSGILKKCIAYLNDTAKSFETVEADLQNT